MAHKYAEIAFTDSVREVQQQLGSRAGYAAFDEGDDHNHLMSEREASFIGARDSFYMASVGETGWPYVQHRGGPAGFVRVIDAQTIGFADFSGNRQYVSVGNLRKDDRVSLFFMDYANRTRLKMLGRVRLLDADEPELLAQLEMTDYRAEVERGFIIHIEAFDWNCPQHITPRYTDVDIETLIAPLQQELTELRAQRPVVRQGSMQSLGQGPLPLVISGIRQLAANIRAYELRDPNGGVLPSIEAGVHLQVPLRLNDGQDAIRHYSICSNPARRDIYEIAVRRDDSGLGGSLALHETFEMGMQLNCELPVNNFTLPADDRPVVLIAGGIGITPIKPMAQALKARASKFEIHYAGRSDREMAFKDRLQLEFGKTLRLYRSANDERMDIRQLLSAASSDALFYICGPARLIDAFLAAANELGLDPDRLRFERFTPLEMDEAKPFRLELKRSGIQIEVSADQSMLDAMLNAGVEARYSCRLGNCRSCAVEVSEGQVVHRDSALSTEEREQDRLMCPCVSRASGDRLVVDL